MVTPDQLTDRQREVYNFIRERIHSRGYGPTVREIKSHFQISSPNGVMCHLKALEKKGMIVREPNMSRAITLATESLTSHAGLPLAGRIAAGGLVEAIETADTINLTDLFPAEKGNLFVLKVQGDSMIEDQIADGDFAIIRKQATAHRGDIVVALTDEGESTLKRWFPEEGRVRLQPSNPTMKPIYVKAAQVQGVLAGVVRKCR